ncbi:MAG: DUF4960 domain-containing protein [Muribaculaceae bacterium]|nr:DUF4960 domain-containing protein [Muribaculaceae bacterium]
MMKYSYIALFAAGILLTGCQNDDIKISEPILAPISDAELQGQQEGDDYVWKWTPREGQSVQVTVLRDGQVSSSESSSTGSYVHRNIETQVPYTYIFKLTDGTNFSQGVIKSYTRPGAYAVSNLSLKQVESVNASYNIYAEWTPSSDATEVLFVAEAGSRKVSQTLPGNAANFTIDNVRDGEEWNVTVTASNSEGKSLPVSSSLKIGKTAIGFLSEYSTPEELINKGDDDEASAWLWLKSEYPNAQYVYFGDITSAEKLESYRVLFWLRDLEEGDENTVFDMTETINAATPFVRDWYMAGGNLLLWSHATAYIGTLGRVPTDMLRNNDRTIGIGHGGMNGDTWSMAVELNPAGAFKKDASTHPIFKGLDVTVTDRTKLIAFKGPGWTEDHNCLYFNIPSVLTGLGNQDEECYNVLVDTYGIVPLGTWDSQIDYISQLNVWEARQGNTEYKGTVLCIGNGGCEFSMKNEDGTPDISATPKNNQYQNNVLTLAKNSIEYLKSR